jgi:hypothetical protein
MDINSISSRVSFNPSEMAPKMAKKMVEDLDTNKDGSIDKAEFTTGIQKKGATESEASKIFSQIDTKNSGKITATDIETSIKNMANKDGGKGMPPKGAQGGGTPPQGAPPASKGGEKKSSSSANASSNTDNSYKYDVKDKNKDGIVTYKEEFDYYLAHPDKKPAKTSEKGDNNVNTISYNNQGKKANSDIEQSASYVDLTA